MSEPNYDFVLETERLIGRKWRIEDAEEAFTLYSDPEVMRYLGGSGIVPDIEAQRERLATVIERYKDSPYGNWAMRLRDTGELVAVILLKALPDSENIEIGWHLPRSQWGRGYATEGARAALAYGFNQLGLKEILAVLFAENTRSANVTKRIGMSYVGQTDEYYGFDLSLFSIRKP
ncbi:MAG TPA: GNAT family N-acetyltransferase [Fimbriimonadaceae bacterium]|jgi:RimJ/RimL family protein N-acetyltransferase